MNSRLVAGTGLAPPGSIYRLALALADHAKACGMTLVTLKRSHISSSQSCYLTLRDAAARCWRLRVSNHRRPLASRHAPPHYDFVSIDGESGLSSAKRTVELMAAGSIEWATPGKGSSGRKRK